MLAVRVALRVVPVLQYALHEMEEDRRCTIVLLSFRALAAVNCAATWPTRGVEIRNAARGAACDAGDAMADIGNAAQMSAFVRISEQSGHSFRSKVATQFGAKWPPVSV